MTKEKMVTIIQREYDNLLKSEHKLDCLECCGVDNWCGYGDAMEMFYNEEEED